MINTILIKIHLYASMIAAAVLLVVAFTGCVLAFDTEIDHVLNRHLWSVKPGAAALPLETLTQQVRKVYPRARVQSFLLPLQNDLAMMVVIGGGRQVFIDPYTGNVLGDRLLRSTLTFKMRQLHAKLMLGKIGEQVVGYSSLLLVIISVTGLIVWWPRKLYKINPRSSWKRINFDLHSAVGLFSSVVVFLLAFTGVVITFSETAIPIIFKVTGTPPPLASIPIYTPAEGAKLITPDRLLQVAAVTLPDAKVSMIPVPRPDDYPYVDVTKWYPGDDSRGRTIVTINAYTGEVARVQNSRHEAAGTAALNLNRSLHFGQIYGMPTQVVAAIGSFSVLFQTFSGLTIWWIRYRKNRRVKSKAKLSAKLEQPDLVEADI